MNWYEFPEWLYGWLRQLDWGWADHLGYWLLFFTAIFAAFLSLVAILGFCVMFYYEMIDPVVQWAKRKHGGE